MMLSQASRIMLTNLILNSIFWHPFSITWMSNSIPDRLMKVARRFLWGKSGSLHYLHLLPWETIMLPKSNRSLGIKYLHILKFVLQERRLLQSLNRDDSIRAEI